MKALSISLFGLFLLLYSCKEEEIIMNGNFYVPDNLSASYLWQVALDTDTFEVNSADPFLYNNGVMYTSERPFNVQPVRAFMVDTADQNVIWQTYNSFNNDCGSLSNAWGGQHHLLGNLYATLCDEKPRIIDLNIGNVLWDYDVPNGDSNISGWNSLLFYTLLNGTNPFSRSSLMMSDITFSSWDTIISLPMENGYSSHIYPPSVMLNDDNDTLLFFQNRQWTGLPTYDGKIDLYGYNLSKDTIIWEQDDIDIHGNSSVFAPLVYQDKIYFKGGYTLYCLDAITGEILWTWLSQGAAGDLLMSNLIVAENMLIVKTSGEYLYALSPETGAVIWENNDSGPTPYLLSYLDGVLYYVSGNDAVLHAVNVFDGKEYWSMKSPNYAIDSRAKFNNNAVLDSVNKRLYITDHFFLICFQLN